MGEALSKMDGPDKHRRFSNHLAKFARSALDIVHRNFGSLIYSGGDDVLAFLPVSTSLRCALQLRESFLKLVVPEAPEASLSVGIAIAHSMEHMEDLLQFARDAEKHAKEGDSPEDGEEIDPQFKRNALAVHVHPRGGSPVKVRAQWTRQLPERLKQWTDAYLDGSLSAKSAYDLKRVLGDYRISNTMRWDAALFKAAFAADAARVLSGKANRAQAATALEGVLKRVETWGDAESAIAELIVARRLAAAVRQPWKLKGGGRVLQLAD
jgi:CRISPR-associated protein Cmr2